MRAMRERLLPSWFITNLKEAILPMYINSAGEASEPPLAYCFLHICTMPWKVS
jgi:hypothetical protein